MGIIPTDEVRYKLERARFIIFYKTILFRLTAQNIIVDDLCKGGEFIITAEDILEALTEVDGKLVGLDGGYVDPKLCDFYYEQQN